MITNTEYKSNYYEDLTQKVWAGVIVDNVDPLQQGRVKIRIFGKLDIRKTNKEGDFPDEPITMEDYLKEDLFQIPNKGIPWFFQAGRNVFGGGESKGYGNFDFPKLGTVVQVVFVADDINCGQYYNIVQPNTELLTLIKDKDGLSNYINSHVITLDEDEKLKVFYTQSQGLELNLKDSRVLIRPDNSIFIEHVNSSSMIELKGDTITVYSDNIIQSTSKNKIVDTSQVVHSNGKTTLLGTNPVYSATRAEPLGEMLKALAAIIDSKWSPTPGVASSLVEAGVKAMTSRTVKTT